MATLPHLKIEAQLDSLTKATNLRDWLQNKLNEKTLHARIGDGQVHLITPNDITPNPTLTVQVRFLNEQDRQDITTQIKNKINQTTFKNSIQKVTITQHECTHAEPTVTPCTETTIYQWP